ncbi:MAG: AI-2E family transporter [Propionibacteriaceae bacterium]|nr:AI-2E family transporter [Propionibacteriaceae bacterium]
MTDTTGDPAPEPAVGSGPAVEPEPAVDPVPGRAPAGDPAPVPAPGTFQRPLRVVSVLAHPFVWAFTGTVGVLAAMALGNALAALATVVMSVVIALFFALALDPLVRKLERRGLSRGRSIGVVFAGFGLVMLALLAYVVPATVQQVISFAQTVPAALDSMQQSAWFTSFTSTTGGQAFYDSLIAQVQAWLSNPSNIFALGGGVLAFGSGVVGGISTSMIVIVLTMYFVASLEDMKNGLYILVPAYQRPKVAELTEQITGAVGGFVAGGIQLSSLNASFSFVLLAVLGVPYAVMLAFIAWFVTLIPMIGSVVFWVIATSVCLLHSWPTALIFAVLYFAYMQVEAYVLTPRIMNKAVAVPGPLVLIGAMIGGSLLGLLGALMAVPLTASVLLVLRGVYIPKQNARTSPEGRADVPTPEPAPEPEPGG